MFSWRCICFSLLCLLTLAAPIAGAQASDKNDSTVVCYAYNKLFIFDHVYQFYFSKSGAATIVLDSIDSKEATFAGRFTCIQLVNMPTTTNKLMDSLGVDGVNSSTPVIKSAD